MKSHAPREALDYHKLESLFWHIDEQAPWGGIVQYNHKPQGFLVSKLEEQGFETSILMMDPVNSPPSNLGRKLFLAEKN